MAGYLTTHVLDTARGCPASGMFVALYRLDGDTRDQMARVATNADGRTDGPILPEERFASGQYELVFEAGPYFEAMGGGGSGPRFLGEIPIRFGMNEAVHYHVPLLLSPYGYTTYRGS